MPGLHPSTSLIERAAGTSILSALLRNPKAATLLLAAGLLLFGASPVRADDQPREVASYDIAVRLDAERKQLGGSERITFLNDSSQPVEELYLHLYPNAFSGPDSTFMKESPSAARASIAENNWGGMEVSALRLASGYDLLPASTVDDTIMKVPLPEPLGTGESLQLETEFSVNLPRVIARSGYQGDHFTVAQWFPKLAALTDKGWVAHQYHASSEFFADFGSYRVEITLPDRFVVGATGVPAGERSNGDGTRTLAFEAQTVHDFAWVANPTFREARAKAGDTEIRLLYQAGHESQKDRFLSAAVSAVENFGQWYGPYAYPLLTVADVPQDAGSGMEYPTLVTVGTTDPPIPGLLLEEQVTIHEIAHQWWYGMVASNEFEEAWLDEGFATYSTRKLSDRLYGQDTSMGSFLGLNLPQLSVDRTQYLAIQKLDPVVQDSWKFYDFNSYGGNVYGKGSLILGTLEGYLGTETMDEVMADYFRRYAFRHPTTRDFTETVNRVSGRSFDRFFQQALHSSAIFDYSAESPSVTQEGNEHRSTITALRQGDGVMPVDVVTTFQDGHQEREVWDGEARWQRYEYVRPSPAIKVEVDPERKLLLDTRWANNSYTTWFNAEPILKQAAALLWLAQGWLKLLGFAV